MQPKSTLIVRWGAVELVSAKKGNVSAHLDTMVTLVKRHTTCVLQKTATDTERATLRSACATLAGKETHVTLK